MADTPLIVHYLHRDNFGGGPKNVAQVIDALADLAEQHVITAGSGRLTELARTRKDITIHTLTDHSTALLPLMVWQLRSRLALLRPQLILTHGQWGGMVMGMALRTLPPKQAMFVTQWCSLYESRDVWRAARNWLAEWLAFSKHQHIICASEGNVRQFLYAGLINDRSRVTVIPNPVEKPVPVATEVVVALNPPARINGVKTFVFLGRLERQKRPDWLLQAWKLALNAGLQRARLLILGEGSWRVQCEQLIRSHDMAETVQMLGHRADGAAYLQNADAMLLTSLYEGHANVVLEALALGVPVLTMATDGVQETLTDGKEGFVVPLGDVGALAQRILRISQEPELGVELGRNGRQRAEDYSLSSMHESYREAVAEALGKARRVE